MKEELITLDKHYNCIPSSVLSSVLFNHALGTQYSSTYSLVVSPFAIIAIAIVVEVRAVAMSSAILPIADVFVSTRQVNGTLSIDLSVRPLSCVLVTVRIPTGTLAVDAIVIPRSNILRAVIIAILTAPMSLPYINTDKNTSTQSKIMGNVSEEKSPAKGKRKYRHCLQFAGTNVTENSISLYLPRTQSPS